MRVCPLDEAVGLSLCHDVTRIVPGVSKGARFKRGHVVQAEDIPVLRAMGKEHLFVTEQLPGMVHEDEAAARLARLCAGANVRAAAPAEGKIELFAGADGVFCARSRVITALNAEGELALVIRRPAVPVCSGDKLAGVKAIPLFIMDEKLRRAEAIAAGEPLLSVRPVTVKQACLVVTGSEIAAGLVDDAFTPALEKKLAPFGIRLLRRFVTEDGTEKVAAAIAEARACLREAAAGGPPGIIFCSGGMSVDPDDNTPGAIRQSGARVVCYGVPVFPGAMFMLAYFDDGMALAGLPGCVMHARTTILDIVLPSFACENRLVPEDFYGLGIGGLCLNCPECHYPVCPFGA